MRRNRNNLRNRNRNNIELLSIMHSDVIMLSSKDEWYACQDIVYGDTVIYKGIKQIYRCKFTTDIRVGKYYIAIRSIDREFVVINRYNNEIIFHCNYCLEFGREHICNDKYCLFNLCDLTRKHHVVIISNDINCRVLNICNDIKNIEYERYKLDITSVIIKDTHGNEHTYS